MITSSRTVCGCPRLIYVPDGLNTFVLDEYWAVRDVYLKRVVLTAGAGTLYDAETIDITYNDNDGQGLWFQGWDAVVQFLNETFSTELELKSLWNIAGRGAWVNYQNAEAYASGQLEVDQGVAGSDAFDINIH